MELEQKDGPIAVLSLAPRLLCFLGLETEAMSQLKVGVVALLENAAEVALAVGRAERWEK